MPISKVSILLVAIPLSSLISSCQLSLNKRVAYIIKQTEKTANQVAFEDSILLKLQSTNDLVYGYAISNEAWAHVPVKYYLIAFNNNDFKAYKYTLYRTSIVGEKPWSLDSFSISQENAAPIIKGLRNYRPWLLKYNDDSTAVYCPPGASDSRCFINDASDESFIIMTKTHLNSSTFYAPEFFENTCCPGNEKRQLFLKLIKPVLALFKHLGVLQ